jgi:hypothetical protein
MCAPRDNVALNRCARAHRFYAGHPAHKCMRAPSRSSIMRPHITHTHYRRRPFAHQHHLPTYAWLILAVVVQSYQLHHSKSIHCACQPP